MESTSATKGSILIAHIGDVHLRDTQYATAQRSQDFADALLRAIRAAKEAGADCIVCTGDNFDVARPSAKVIGQLTKAHSLLQKLGLPMFTITGNHDYSSPSWLSVLFPWDEGQHVTGIYPIDGETVHFKGFNITGIPPYTARAFREKTEEIATMTRYSDVVLYHGMVTGVVPMFVPDNGALAVAELPLAARNKAILLGDIHVQGFIPLERPGGGTTIVGYPGSLEMCSKSESTEKSIPLIRVSEDAATVERFIPLDIRKFIAATVRNSEELDALVARAKAVSFQHPVVLVEFDRSIPETVARLHAVLDPQRAVVRCYPLPSDNATIERCYPMRSSNDELGLDHFVRKQFEASDTALADVAIRLLHNGETNAANIVSELIETRLANREVVCAS